MRPFAWGRQAADRYVSFLPRLVMLRRLSPALSSRQLLQRTSSCRSLLAGREGAEVEVATNHIVKMPSGASHESMKFREFWVSRFYDIRRYGLHVVALIKPPHRTQCTQLFLLMALIIKIQSRHRWPRTTSGRL